jgi:very-short-patch-repair endonuclease
MKIKKPRKASKHELRFEEIWKLNGGPLLEREYKFLDDRRFRFDFAFLPKRIAIELEGAVWTGGRHTRGSGFVKDAEKYGLAALEGWLIFRLPPNMINSIWVQYIINKCME